MSGSGGVHSRIIALAAALLGLSAVVLAALGSHVVDIDGQPQLQRVWQTASGIHMFHAAALLALASLLARLENRGLYWSAWLLVTGVVIFCGSLYLRVILPMPAAPLAPLGGLLLMAGWSLAAVALVRPEI